MRATVLLATALLFACTKESTKASTAVERDSAGVHIVENGSRAPATWTVGSTPTIDIGGTAGDTKTELSEVVHAARIPDGRIVVLNGGTQELRFFDSTGTFLTAAGRKGSGPGEFEAPVWMRTAAAQIFVYDILHRRFTVLDTAGGLVQNFSFSLRNDVTASVVVPVDRMPDGRILANNAEFKFPFPGGAGATRRDSAWVLLFDSTGALVDSVGHFPANDFFGLEMNFGGQSAVVPMPMPFPRTLAVAAVGQRVYIGTGDTYEFGMYGADGTLRGLVRRKIEPHTVTSDDIARFKEFRRTQPLPQSVPKAFEETLRSAYDKAPFPKTTPPYAAFTVDDDGNLWVQESVITGDDPTPWSIFAPDGKLLASVTTPARFRLTQAGSGFVLGVWQDEDDVQHVRSYSLTR